MKVDKTHPRSQCVTFRARIDVFKQLSEEAESTKNTVSDIINSKLSNAFRFLLSALEKVEQK